jgi:hypothetical protein
MTLKTPWAYAPSLTPDLLQTVANWLLDEFHATEDDLIRATDTTYTRGCATFGRQRARIIAEWKSQKHPWLGLLNAGNALVFTINGVPCRFSNDNPDSPTKEAVVGLNPYQVSFAEFAAANEPATYCFVVDRGLDGLADPYVALDGYSRDSVHLCRWASSSTVTAFEVVGGDTPPTVEVEKAKIGPKQKPIDEEAANDASAS